MRKTEKTARPTSVVLSQRQARCYAIEKGEIIIIIVTNNPRLKDEEQALFVDGSFKDVLVKVRDMVYSGHALITHPLFASSRMNFSPFRTVLVGDRRDAISTEECQIIEDSIILYDNLTARRRRQPEHDDDYAEMDLSLYHAALEELEMLKSSHII